MEFRVTHEVDNQKSAYIREHGIYCIEIDLRCLLNTEYTQETVYQFLVNREDSRSWICCPVWDEEHKKALEKIKQEEAEREQEEIRKKLQEEQEAKKFVSDWMKSGDKEGAEKLVQYLRVGVCTSRPFDYYRELMQDGSIWQYMDRAPRTPYALNVFYQLLFISKANGIFRAVDEHGLRLLIEDSLKRDDYIKSSELLMIYILFITPNRDVKIIRDGDEYVRFYSMNFMQLLNNWTRRKTIIEDVLKSPLTGLDERIEYTIFNVLEDSYLNISAKERERQKQQKEEEQRELLAQQRRKKEEKYRNPFNIAFVKDRMKGWNLQELEAKIQEYKQNMDNPQFKEYKAAIREIYYLLQQHRTNILNHYPN